MFNFQQFFSTQKKFPPPKNKVKFGGEKRNYIGKKLHQTFSEVFLREKRNLEGGKKNHRLRVWSQWAYFSVNVLIQKS
jgi:hypothetical protein